MGIKNISFNITIQDDFIFGDNGDEDAPLIKISFHNEMKQKNIKQKIEILKLLFENIPEE